MRKKQSVRPSAYTIAGTAAAKVLDLLTAETADLGLPGRAIVLRLVAQRLDTHAEDLDRQFIEETERRGRSIVDKMEG